MNLSIILNILKKNLLYIYKRDEPSRANTQKKENK